MRIAIVLDRLFYEELIYLISFAIIISLWPRCEGEEVLGHVPSYTIGIQKTKYYNYVYTWLQKNDFKALVTDFVHLGNYSKIHVLSHSYSI